MKEVPRFKRLLYSTLYLLPLFSISDVMSLYYGSLTSHVSFTTPLAIKLIKDFFFLVSILYFFQLKREKDSAIFSQISVWGLMSLVTISIFILLVNDEDKMLILAGLRWVLPFVLIAIAVGVITKEDLIFIADILKKLFYLHFIFQLAQLFFGGHYYGISGLGLNARSPGIFVIPNTAGLFTVFCAFMVMYYTNTKHSFMIHAVFIISAFLTGSGTAIFVLLLMYISSYTYYYRKLLILFSPIIMIILLVVMMFVLKGVRTENYIQASLGTRLGIIFEYMINSNFFSSSFGTATNTANLMGIPSARTPDSVYASILGNLGWSGMLIYISAICYGFYISEHYKDKELFVFIVIFSMMAFTSVISEAFPMNYISALLLAYYLRKRNVTLNDERQRI